MDNLIFNNITFSYITSSSPVFKNVSLFLDKGWTGIIGINGIGKSTFLKLCTGLLHPQIGTITYSGESLYCEQRTDLPPENFHSFLASYKNNSHQIQHILGIKKHWPECWNFLSEGERKKAWIGIECMEIALNECNSAMLLVSHDEYFLKNLAHIRWHIHEYHEKENGVVVCRLATIH